MADSPNSQMEPYVPDPAEIKRAYWILAFILFWVVLFMYALIETVMRHGNPFDIILGGGGSGGGGH